MILESGLAGDSARRSTHSFVALDARKERVALHDAPAHVLTPAGRLGKGRRGRRSRKANSSPNLLGDARHGRRHENGHEPYGFQGVAHDGVERGTRLHAVMRSEE